MITEDSLAKYWDLCNFISANDELQRQAHMVNLRETYSLYRKKNQVFYNANPNKPSNYSALEVVSMLGKLEHVRTLLFSSHRWGGRDGHTALILAAEAGHLNVVEELFKLTWIQHQIRSKFIFNLWEASAKSGNLDLIEYLFKHLPIQNFMAADVNGVLLRVILAGHMPIVERLLQEPYVLLHLNPSPCLERAVHYKYTDIVHRLLSIPSIFNYADQQNIYAEEYLYLFVMRRIETLMEKKSISSPMFDMSENDAHLCYYMIRYFIRQNKSSDHYHVEFLLSIEKVRVLLKTSVTLTTENELLKVAINSNNYDAEKCLLSISTIREHAEQHSYYGNVDAKNRQKQRDKEIQRQIRLTFFCFLQLTHNTKQPINQKNTKKMLENNFLCYEILSYLLPNPRKIKFFEEKFHANTMKFFNTIKNINHEVDSTVESIHLKG